jgi:hypothetical protein
VDDTFWKVCALALCTVVCALCSVLIAFVSRAFALVQGQALKAIVDLGVAASEIAHLQKDIDELREEVSFLRQHLGT